ncbi:ribosomal protein S18 acetylase RimI-like enzyme [Desulfobaculum xiamenense]|uniref:Ribosomal protein S18 acetylase RimI-like enzyme n=1 Tax=Desulfobaculum xiamenense TaxID=995050 RepID=A0A846QH70_9BACT|nr:ribosomal protein S18 acetylase RimI-like enzyme [Desulfobaculum xiamenense]
MDIAFHSDCAGINWEEAASVFRRAPLGEREPQPLRQAFESSQIVCFAFADGQLVGLGRALTDGIFQAAIYDICVLPEYQGRGIGHGIVDNILSRLDVRTVLLFSAPGKEPFYAKLGFRRLRTGMGLFSDVTTALDNGYIE